MSSPASSLGRKLALTAALLGWMFDGLEMGLFPLVARPALHELLHTDAQVAAAAATGGGPAAAIMKKQLDSEVGLWFGVITAGFLVGAATGGVLFGWLGDKIGRVRAMTLSVLVYAGCSGLCAAVQTPWQLAGLRFAGALGMGGEWALGVALVMELWPDRGRGWLAGWIGAFGNFGYGVVGIVAYSLVWVKDDVPTWLTSIGFSQNMAATLTANNNWRLLMAVGALPAVLTLFIRLLVPESEKWQREKDKGGASKWSERDLLGVLVGAAAAAGIIYIWAEDFSYPLRIAGTILGVGIVTVGYLYPVRGYLSRAGMSPAENKMTIRRMLLAAGLSGVPLLATWGGVMWMYNFVDELTKDPVTGVSDPTGRPITMMVSSLGAAFGCVAAAVFGDKFGRRPVYAIMCIMSLGIMFGFFRMNTHFGWEFIVSAFLVGAITASFYGWLPLYLPELFRTGMRATGQGFGFNFGRIIAAVGALQTGALLKAFDNNYGEACSVAAGVYLFGLVLIMFAPETKGKPLPD